MPIFGLRNAGNTCYMNALLQFVMSFQPVTTRLTRIPMNDDAHSKHSPVLRKLKTLLSVVTNVHRSLKNTPTVPVLDVSVIVEAMHTMCMVSEFAAPQQADCVNMGFTYLVEACQDCSSA